MQTCIYYVYMVTNPDRSQIYTGMTNNLGSRLFEHYHNGGNEENWAGKYYCYKLIYYEEYQYVDRAIAREKQLKKWSRKKKEDLIHRFNPKWEFLNNKFPVDPDVWSRRKKL